MDRVLFQKLMSDGSESLFATLKFVVLPIAKVFTMFFLGFLMASKYVNILPSNGRKLLNGVAEDPSGKHISTMEQHVKSLLSPSTPFFFNTLYEPYRDGADFVRWYPFSLREGVRTAVSGSIFQTI